MSITKITLSALTGLILTLTTLSSCTKCEYCHVEDANGNEMNRFKGCNQATVDECNQWAQDNGGTCFCAK